MSPDLMYGGLDTIRSNGPQSAAAMSQAMNATGITPSRRAFARATMSARGLVSVPTPNAPGNSLHEREKERTAPGAEIGDPARTRARALRIDGGERRLDDRFALRPRHQRRLGERKLQAPEFLAAHDARDRLASEAPARKGLDRVARLAIEHARASRRERRLVEAKRMTDKNTRIEFG